MQPIMSSAAVQEKLAELTRQKVKEAMQTAFSDAVESVFDMQQRVKKELNVVLEPNQVEVVETILDPTIKNISLIASRSGGKTFSTITGATLLSVDGVLGKPVTIGITAPKEEQATRCISEFKSKIMSRSPYIRSLIDEKSTTNARVVFKSGSIWEAFSGSELANEEGRHYDCFPSGTKILMADGTLKNIEKVLPGDLVVSCNLEDMSQIVETVLARHSREDEELVEISYEVDGVIVTTRCTPEHKIITERGEVRAGDLREDDIIYAVSGD